MMARGVLAPARWRLSFLWAIHFLGLLISSVSARPEFTMTVPTFLRLGEPFPLKWKNTYGPFYVSLVEQDEKRNWKEVENIFSGVSDSDPNAAIWTPPKNRNLQKYAFQIQDSSGDPPNYSKPFQLVSSDSPAQPTEPSSAPAPTNPSITISASQTTKTTGAFPTSNSPTSTPTAEPVSGFEALSTGAKAGIGAGAGASVILLFFLICYFFYRRGRSAGLKASAEAFRAAGASGAFVVGGGGRQGGHGGNPEDVEYGRSASGRGVYSPAPESDLGEPPVVLGGEGISGSGFASSDDKSVPTLVSSVPDPPPVVHTAGNVAATTGRTGTMTTQITGTSEVGRDSPAAGAAQVVSPVAGAGASTGVGDGTLSGSGSGTLNTNPNNIGRMGSNTVAPLYIHPPTPGPGVYEMPTSPEIMPGTMHMMPQGHGMVPVQVPLVNSQPYVVYGVPGTGQPMRMVMQPHYFDEGDSMGMMGPNADRREGR